jgi:hypothetical protein
MASNKFVIPTIPCFDDHYNYWRMLMENVLWSKEYWQIIS